MPSKNITEARKEAPTAKTMRPDDLLFRACGDAVSMADLDKALAKGASVNARNSSGETPLMLACTNYMSKQYIPFSEKLLANGAEVNTESEWGLTVMDKLLEKIKA